MNWFWDLNLFHFFEFYLAAVFLFGLYLRVRQYRAILALLRAMPGRWPRLLALIKQQHGIFLTWRTVLPAGLYLALWLTHTLACRLIWPSAHVTPENVITHPLALVVVLTAGAGMVGLDMYTLVKVSEIDRSALEAHFDQAEYWLRSWTAPLVRMLSFGYLDPRQIVHTEVEKALTELNRLVGSTLWWVSLQTTLRLTFGLSIWVSWAYLGASAP